MTCRHAVPEGELGRSLKSYFYRLHLTRPLIRHVCAIARVEPATMLRSLGYLDAMPATHVSPGESE
jgi:hypothetical protein